MDLSSNLLQVLPNSFFSLSSLVSLNLRANHLQYLPGTINSLSALTQLDLSANAFWTLPANLGILPNLAILNLSHCHLVVLPTSLNLLPNLGVIDLDGNFLNCTRIREGPYSQIIKSACDPTQQRTGGVTGVIIYFDNRDGLTQEQILSQLAAEIALALNISVDKVQLVSIKQLVGGWGVEVEVITDTESESNELADKLVDIIRTSDTTGDLLSKATDADLRSKRRDDVTSTGSAITGLFSFVVALVVFTMSLAEIF
jgi:hypothetical protein